LNKTIFLALLVAGAIGTMFFGNHLDTSAHAMTLQQRQACAQKYLPENTAKYNICIGGMKSG